MLRNSLAGGALATLMIAAAVVTAAPAQATVSVTCATGIDPGTNGSYVRAKCSGAGVIAYKVRASCLRPDGSGLRYTAIGDLASNGYWSTYYPCRSPRNVRGEALVVD